MNPRSPTQPSPPSPPFASIVRGGLVFQWAERRVSFVLPAFFILAVAVHALAFYLFQVVYPPVTSALPPSAQVTLITPSSPAHTALLAWIEAQNPASAPRLQEKTPSGLGEIAYVPSYATVETLPKPAELAPAPAAYPPARDPLGLLSSMEAVRETPREAVRTSLAFSGPIRERERRDADSGRGNGGEPLRFSTQATGSLLPSVFLVGVGERGEVLYTFLQSSSGSRALDEEAEKLLARHEFTRSGEGESGVAWGFATFTWGAEAFAASGPVSSSFSESPGNSSGESP